MQYVTLYNTSLTVSNICLGGGNFGTSTPEALSFALLDRFVSAGGNFIDTANVYGKWMPVAKNYSEAVIGKWLKANHAYHKVIVATKGGHYDLSTPQTARVNKREIQKDLDESLQTLGLDCIDLYWLHRDDESQPIETIIDTMEGFVSAGKIRYYGASNYKLERMEAAYQYAQQNNYQGFSAVSNQWSLASANPRPSADPSLVSLSDAFYAWHVQTKLPLIPYSATASGFFEKLFLKQPQIKDGVLLSPCDNINTTYLNERNLRIYADLLPLKDTYKVSLYTLSLACLLQQPFDVIPISSANNIAQLKGFLQASDIVMGENLIAKYRVN